MSKHSELETIIDGGYCIGCGACSIASPSINIELDQYGKFQAQASGIPKQELSATLQVCPFSNHGLNENELGKQLFEENCQHNEAIGFYQKLFAGYVQEKTFREDGASGGMISWVLTELLKSGKIDAVAHVKKVESPKDGVLFRYGISRTEVEIRAGAKSRYYPIEMSKVLEEIKTKPGRYVVVGLPCFIKSVRRLAEVDPIIKERVVFCVGLVCGHLKSKAFAEYFAWQAGTHPSQLKELDFRVKLEGESAGNYGVLVKDGMNQKIIPTRNLKGSNWGHNFFRYPACDYCDDVFAETADIAIGDAWLPKYESDPKGTSIVVVRNPLISTLLDRAKEQGRVVLCKEGPSEISESQAGGLRDRREGLAYRLYLKKLNQKWFPEKRVSPTNKGISRNRADIYENRMLMGRKSHMAWADAVSNYDISIVDEQMKPFISKHETLYKKEARWKNTKSKFKRRCLRILHFLRLKTQTR